MHFNVSKYERYSNDLLFKDTVHSIIIVIEVNKSLHQKIIDPQRTNYYEYSSKKPKWKQKWQKDVPTPFYTNLKE